MLNYVAQGPFAGGSYAAVYQTPGCAVMTVASLCLSMEQAEGEAKRLNREQAEREAELIRERELCGLFRIRSDLKGPRSDR